MYPEYDLQKDADMSTSCTARACRDTHLDLLSQRSFSCLMRTLCFGNAEWLNVVNRSLLSALKSCSGAEKLSRFRVKGSWAAQATEASKVRVATRIGSTVWMRRKEQEEEPRG